jgi:hypothetical protein
LKAQTAWRCRSSAGDRPFDRDAAAAVQRCFDRDTCQLVETTQLQSYRQVLAQYHLHPEAKFAHADYTVAGVTARRHILATALDHTGKQANRWEEQFFLGEDPEAQIVYGAVPAEHDRAWGSPLQSVAALPALYRAATRRYGRAICGQSLSGAHWPEETKPGGVGEAAAGGE